MKATFVIPGQPKGKARPRVTKRGTFTPKSTVEYECYVRTCYQQQCPDVYFGENAIKVSAVAYVTPLKQLKKADKQACLDNKTHPSSKPDADNILKGIMDALNEFAFADDRYIYAVNIVKRFSAEPRVEVTIATEDEYLPLEFW